MNHPVRQNHRIIPIRIAGTDWFLQYSPYVYYNEHCNVFNSRRIPMKIDREAFAKLLDFVTSFPHYCVVSNADLPIVGGSILSLEHFQGGRLISTETEGEPHNTITPIARRRGEDYELDLVLRNNITTLEHPLGVYHPHAELHHIKKENICFIEVMGFAVLPSRLKGELEALEEVILSGPISPPTRCFPSTPLGWRS